MNQTISIRTGFQPLTHDIAFGKQKIRKGKDLAKKHVKRVEELHAIGACKLIRSSCVRSVKVGKSPYTVTLGLNDSRKVTHPYCSCVSGRAGKCKHIFALIHYINTDRSQTKTAREQGWDKPSDLQLGKDIYAKPLVLADKYEPNNNFADLEPYNVTLEDLQDIDCPLRNVIRVESMNREDLEARAKAKIESLHAKANQEKSAVCECAMLLLENSPREEELYWNTKYELDPSLQEFYESNIKVTNRTVFETCTKTVNQSSNKLWFDVRHMRISASSRAHKIKTRTRKSSLALANEFMQTEKKVSTPAMEYGKKNEKRAVREYAELYDKVVRHVGVFIMPLQPWLCGSPDGVVVENNGTLKILEIKCPSSCKSKPVYDKSENKFNVGYLYSENGTTRLKSSHEYYSQCQMLMYITGLKECHLYVWSPKGSVLVLVERDETHLKKVIPKIEEFYFKVFLPKLFDINKENTNNNSNE